MRTHFLDFKDSTDCYRVRCTKEVFDKFMAVWRTNPSYPEKLAIPVDAMKQCGMIFTMGDFTGRGGKASKTPDDPLPLPEPPEADEARRVKNRTIIERYRGEGRCWIRPETDTTESGSG